MAVKTFTTGEVLTSADTNKYLANSGLVYITEGSLSTSTTQFQGVFESTYDNYLIVIDKLQVSTGVDIYYRFMTGATENNSAEYFWAYLGLKTDATAANSNAQAQTEGFTGLTVSASGSVLGSATLTCYGPNLSQRTFITSNAYGYPAQWGFRFGASHINITNQFTGISFKTLTAGTMSGRVTIYGYRKA